ncbi:dolichyl-P-Man:Man(6)GlcNAc(2)-PP-dolichol alpha-1,2-mannosyltransferase [Aspergillus candidus]|uniref:Mannosyltransferase n=1 Tax=Aspergillus candidus TaxID=41067 RepID=A0A2I2F0H1_ASPCN|nr:Alg9-like mannosyltransferase family-domain-containing protein [Aspergillus candidus]PLB34124.1 Alg9-like mannosyltransferase family-domain-containing protein [Aspergillus candidus]
MSSPRRRVQVSSASLGDKQPLPKKGPPSPFYLPLDIAFYICLISNGIAAFLAPIQDCDEVFNFWEPAHYLNQGYGLQTWEYSPVYSIRSWLYVVLHASVGKVASLVLSSKSSQFYAIRFVLAFVCAACETRLYSALCRILRPRIGLLFLMVVACSPGMFHASAAFLPSSFTMYMSMLGLTAFLDWRSGQKIAQGIMWFGLGAIVGWPFAGALILPLLLEEAAIAFVAGSMKAMVRSTVKGALRCLAILAAEIAVDYTFLRKVTIVPWNIVAYNIFGGEGRGPEIFGTEPWTFYVKNLLLNFNVWFLFAVAAAPLLLLQTVFRFRTSNMDTLLRTVTLILPFYMWMAIFTAQPHKEERFMYPAYPFLALNAAIAFDMVLSYIGSQNPKELIGRVPVSLKLTAVMSIVLLAVNGGFFRTLGMVTAYNAPLKVFEPLEQPGVVQAGDTLCLGKEWYRFPSSFFLPHGMRAKFIRSEFRGLLPGEFREAVDYPALIDGTSRIPTGMNDRNEEDPEKYVDISQCTFLVDSSFPGNPPTALEPDYIHDETQWEQVSCRAFLDASRTGLLGRLVWIPDLPIIPDRFRRQWGEYCLLQRRDDPAILPAETMHLQTLDIKHATAIGLVVFTFIYLLRLFTQRLKVSRDSLNPENKTAVTKFSKPSRKPGEWIPSTFQRPPACPYPNWDIHTTKPIPYRPFKYGPKYFITMGLRSMKWDEWIELDNQYDRYHADKARRIEQRGEKCCRTAPEAYEGACELLEELRNYLPQRYPTIFRRTPTGLRNTHTHETFNTTQRPLPEDPMTTSARLVQDDLALMIERPDGEYYLLAGAILLAGFWRLSDKFGMRLSEIHTSGSVPGYREKLEKGMSNFFRRLKPEEPVLRNNYFMQVDDGLAWSKSIGDEDGADVSWNTAERDRCVEQHFFRSERQSLRRLPRSGAIVFTIRTYFEPVTAIVREPYVPGRLAAAVRSWGDDVARYKGREKYGAVLLEYLDRMHEEQVRGGLLVGGEEEGRYPF